MSEKYWTKKARDLLVGRQIVRVDYMDEATATEYGWYSRPVVLLLDDGTFLVPSSDDEGNDGGAIHTNKIDCSVLPVIGGSR